MLVLSRKPDEFIQIGETIQVRVLEVNGNKVRLGIVAPREVPIRRGPEHVNEDGTIRDDDAAE